MVDADLRRPALHKIFKLTNKVGLSDFLSGTEKELKIETVIKPNLIIISSGSKPLNPSKLVNSDRMRHFIKLLLERASNLYDFVLIDSSPVLAVADTALLASLVEGVVLVVNAGQVTKNEAKRTKDVLEKAGARILGTVLNNFNEYHGIAYHPYSPLYLRLKNRFPESF